MKSIFFSLFALFALPFASFAQDDEKPIITFHTNLYEEDGENNQFSIALGATKNGQYVYIDCGDGPMEMEIDYATYDENDSTIHASTFEGKVSPEGIVRIYGDASKIDYVNFSGCGITNIEFAPELALQILNLEHNSLQSLNINSMKKLQVLYLADNPFAQETPLDIDSLPNIVVMEVGQIDNIAPHWDLGRFPLLTSFDAYHSLGLKSVNVSNCPYLVRLSLEMTAVSSLDVSKNSYLQVLNVSESRIKTLDLSKCQSLYELYCTHTSGSINTDIKMNALDVTGCPRLEYLFCGGNNFTELDLTKSERLFDLSAPKNKLRSINLENCLELYNVNISGNDMDFVTLPTPGAWGEYYYQQNDMPLNDTYKVGDVINLAERLMREGTETSGAMYYTEPEAPTEYLPVPDSCYTYSNGKITLLTTCMDKDVFMVFTNSELAEYPLYTEKFKVRTAEDFGKDIKAIEFASLTSTGSEIAMAVGIVGATPSKPVTVKADFGDGVQKEFKITSERPSAANVKGTRTEYGNICLYVPQDEYICHFSTNKVDISNINLKELTELRVLELKNAGLYSIDLSYNAKLERLDLTGNNLSTLDLTGPSYYYYKSMLKDVNASKNSISTFKFNDLYSVKRLNLGTNKLTELDLSDADNLTYLNLSNNQFESLTLTYSEVLDTLNVSNNKLTSIYVPEAAPLTLCNIMGNQFTLADMPELYSSLAERTQGAKFTYAPQSTLQIATNSPGVDLSDQDVEFGGYRTEFTWKTKAGSIMVEGTDYTIEGGSAKFLSPVIGTEVYCEMTHKGLSQFSGLGVYRTTYVTPISMPSVELASFTTTSESSSVELSLAAEKDGTSVYFDWDGDGNVTQYTLGTSYKRFSASSKAGVKVRVLVADENDKLSVFSISKAAMSDIDLTNMKVTTALTIADAGLSKIELPQMNGLSELNLSNNNLSELDLTKVPNLMYISLNGNNFTSFDLSGLKGLQLAYLGNNKAESVTLNNPLLWNLDLGANNLESIDFTKAPNIDQLWLNDNNFTDVTCLDKLPNLKVVDLVRNHLNFATLPIQKDTWSVYSYGKQKNMTVDIKDAVVDLSSQAVRQDSVTTYRWFIGMPEIDEDTDELVGEELEEGEGYTLVNGVTTFHYENVIEDVICVMTNPLFPNLTLYTDPITIIPTGIDDVAAERIMTSKPGKYIRGNRVVIVNNGKTFTVEGIGRAINN